jgi:hypothetical protein
MSSKVNYAQAIEHAKALAQSGKIREAKKLLFEISCQLPNQEHASQLMAEISRKQKFKPTSQFKTQFSSLYLTMAQSQISTAMNGWLYAAAIDQNYLSNSKPEITRQRQVKKQRSAAESPELAIANEIEIEIEIENSIKERNDSAPISLELKDDSPETFFAKLASIEGISARWQWINQFIAKPSKLLCSDSYVGSSKSEIQKRLNNSPSKDLSLVIVGAGCTGLALANTCKRYFGKRIDILLIEPRVQKSHQKQVYSRNWLTNLGLAMLKPIIEPQVYQVLAEFGQEPYAGTNIALLESLLLISCKQQGVKFLFDADYSLDFVSPKTTHILVDATGGRWPANLSSHPTQGVALPSSERQSIDIPNLEHLAKGFTDFGVHADVLSPDFSLSLVYDDRRLVPHVRIADKPEQKLLSHLVKVAGIRPSEATQIKDRLLKDNPQNRFYLWPGRMKDQFNEALLLVNISAEECEHLAYLIPYKIDLSTFLKSAEASADPIAHSLRSLILEILPESSISTARIEPPFQYAPYFCAPQECITQFQSVPFIKIGDSLFNGHPKVGNGLGAHLKFVARIRDMLLRTYGE